MAAWVLRSRALPGAPGRRDGRRPLRHRAQGRRPRHLARLRGRRAGARRHARQRRDRRGGDAEPAHDRRDPAARSRTRRRCSRCAARCTCRWRRSLASTSSAPRRASRPTPTRATRRPGRSASSTRSSPPRARCRSGATASARSRGSSFDTHLDSMKWLREHGFRVHPDVGAARHRRRGRGRLPRLGGAARPARLRDRRRGRQGRRPRAPAPARRGGARAARRDRLEVPADARPPRSCAASPGTSAARATWCRSRCSSPCRCRA